MGSEFSLLLGGSFVGRRIDDGQNVRRQTKAARYILVGRHREPEPAYKMLLEFGLLLQREREQHLLRHRNGSCGYEYRLMRLVELRTNSPARRFARRILDRIRSREHVLGMIRDGLRQRDGSHAGRREFAARLGNIGGCCGLPACAGQARRCCANL